MKHNYSFSEIIKNCYSFIFTKLFYRGARLIRRPFYCRGKARLEIAEGFTTGYRCRFELMGDHNDFSKKLIFGRNCKLGDSVHIVANEKVTIGDNCLMASNIFISDTNHGNYSDDSSGESSPDDPPDLRPYHTKPVKIGDNVWIGEHVCILSGVSIGNGCIIGANSVVTKDVMANCIVAGAPIKIIRKYNRATKRWERYSDK